ncbi:MAG: hypothetical protein U1F81_05530 [Verrucomicrobiaceae bacterium]
MSGKVCLLISFVALAIACCCSAWPVRHEYVARCLFTASEKSWSQWPLGIKTNEKYSASALERFVLHRYPQEIDHKWTVRTVRSYDWADHPLSAGPNERDAVHYLTLDFVGAWCAHVTEAEQKALYGTLRFADASTISHRAQEVIMAAHRSMPGW